MRESSEGAIDRLVALQEFDRKLKDKREQVAALSSAADGYELRVAEQRTTVEHLTAERETSEAQRSEMDSRLETGGDKIRNSRMRLTRVRNDRELLALQRQIDLGREANQQLEEELIEVMENLEALNARLAEAKELLDGLESNVDGEVGTRRIEAEALGRELEADCRRRVALVEGMDSLLRRRYEAVFERHGATAVVEVRQGTCTGCYMNVPPQMFNELQRKRDFHQCPYCYRIVYYRPEPMNDESSCDSG